MFNEAMFEGDYFLSRFAGIRNTTGELVMLTFWECFRYVRVVCRAKTVKITTLARWGKLNKGYLRLSTRAVVPYSQLLFELKRLANKA